jgi:predicted transcriptional regulator
MGALEAQVMNVLWDADARLTPREVQGTLARHHPVAYTTVTTILVRLWRKGRLERRREGRAFTYLPLVSRDSFAAGRMNEMLDSSRDRSTALSHFVESLTAQDRARLRRVMQRRSRS